jgi:hypothetical protein
MKRITKIAGWVLLALCLFLYVGAYTFNNVYLKNKPPALTTTTRTNGLVWVPFRWAAGNNSDREALYIPITVDTIANKFYLQFDIGILRTKITSLNRGFPYLKKYVADGKYKGLPVYLGNHERYSFDEHSSIDYKLSKPSDFRAKDTSAIIKIGDAGYDYIKGRIFVCDFRNARYALTDQLPREAEQRVNWIQSPNVRANLWPVHIPLKINGQERIFSYDNGSSMFTLFVTKRFWDDITANGSIGKQDSLSLSSWGEYFWYLRAKPAQKITSMFGEDLSNKKIFYGTRMNPILHELWNHFEGTDGLMGNEYFRDKVLVIDTKANRIGLYN